MVETRAAVLDVVDQPPLAAARDLATPYRCRVVYSKIPRGPDFKRWIVRDMRNTSLAFRLIQELAIVAPRVWRIERALQLLSKLLVAHLLAQPGNSFVREGARGGIIKQIRRVARRDARTIISRLQKAPALWRAAPHQRSIAVSQHGLDYQWHHTLRGIIKLIDYTFVRIAPAPTIGIVRATRLPRSAIRELYRHL